MRIPFEWGEKKLGMEKNSRRDIFAVILGIVLIVTQLYIVIFKPLSPIVIRSLHLSIALTLVFTYIKPGKKDFINWSLGIISIFCTTYIIFHANRLSSRIPFVDQVFLLDIIVTVLYIILLIEATRRLVGTVLMTVVVGFLLYAMAGRYLPGWLRFRGFTLSRLAEIMVMTDLGIFGMPLGVAVSEIFYFLLFGSLFVAIGGGQLFVDLALSLTGKTIGGPAKSSVVGSSLFGMLSGSAVANVMTTGIFTIPLMKKAGYSPEEAAAVEAAASTGGQLMPPVMGAAAFIMAEILGIKYIQVAKSAVIPAIFYYVSIYLVVDFIARKKKLGGFETKVEPIIPRLYLLIPAVVLVYLLIKGHSLGFSAIRAILVCLILGTISKKYRWSVQSAFRVILQTIKEAVSVAIPVAAAGVVIGVATQSGLALKASSQLISLGQGNLAFSLLLGMVICIILGMGIPTVAAYSIGAVLIAPAFIKLGIHPLVAHFFVFFFGVLSMITPPVCVATFAASGLSQSNIWKTGMIAFMFTLPSFFIPFIFVTYPEILLIKGTVWSMVKACLLTVAGIYSLAIGTTGYFRSTVPMSLRFIHVAIGIAILIPELWSSVLGITLLITLTTFEIFAGRKKNHK